MQPYGRTTVLMNDVLPDQDFSTLVNTDCPVVAERAMYWGGGTVFGEACHDSVGFDEPHITLYLPDGQTSEGRETYTMVCNPSYTQVAVRVSYLCADGTGASYFNEIIPAHSHATYDMSERLASGRASIVVISLTPGKKILAERSMYWHDRGAGTNSIAIWARLDEEWREEYQPRAHCEEERRIRSIPQVSSSSTPRGCPAVTPGRIRASPGHRRFHYLIHDEA